MFEEAFESDGFWILSALGSAAIILGYIVGKNMGFEAFPIWQLIIMILSVILASAYFATKE